MVHQQGMLNHLWAKIDSLQLGAGDRLAQTASMNFDISVWQLLAPLLVGGQVVLISDEQVLDPQELLACVHTDQISVLEVVPSLLRALLETLEQAGGGSEVVASLRWLLATGEALPSDLAERWLRLTARVPIVNAYGPTECSDDVSQEVISQVGPYERAWGTIPIGRALVNTRLYVLDGQMQPVPQGVPGELYVAGLGVGRGYLNDPSKTAQAFVPDPFGPDAGGRLYRTGDLARVQAHGRFEYLGRIDQQVKVRGFRLELGEIEAVLTTHARVRACVVIAREISPGEKQLVGYVVAQEPGQEPEPADLRTYLRERLPEYMVPAIWLLLESLPLTPNGKIDRQKLPAPEQTPDETAGYVPPSTELEATLVTIWEQILGVQHIGTRDNFFDLGGHSLKATQVMARVQQTLSVRVPLSNLFGDPTVAGLAHIIERIAQQPQLQQPQLRQSPARSHLHLEDLLTYLEDLPEQEIQALLAQSLVEVEIDV
jgi:acyl-coenzyme A synthetase/AMP-(fatty) acid ligase/acyl carrier protein